jgi:class 3 adenylate cyclase
LGAQRIGVALMRGARVAKWLSAGSIACGLALAAASPAVAEGLSAIVESISPREDVRSFDVLAEGTVIELKPGETLVLGYMDSCAHDSVNVAARLEAANKELGTTILASASTVRAAGAGFQCRLLGPIHVKGRERPVIVHEVVGLPSAASG